MDSSEQALQTRRKLFQFSNYWPKTKNIQKYSEASIFFIKILFVIQE